MSILVIEDNVKLAENIAEYLKAERYAVALAHDGLAGFEKALLEAYDLVILDLNLPKMDGLTVCKRLREEKINSPILMLTARTGAQNTVTGLNSGADDYLAKPFDLQELLARVRALLRRETPSRNPIINSGEISLDSNTHEVTRKGKAVSLAPKEYALLEFLLQHKGRAKDRLEIIDHVWGESSELLFSQTVDVHIAYLRKKFGKEVIKTVPGKGYLIPE